MQQRQNRGRPTVGALGSAGDDNAITFSNDGRLIFFGNDRPGGCGGTDISSARRADPHDDCPSDTKC